MLGGSEPIVVNTGPLIALQACGQLELLGRLHSTVLIPADVAQELGRGRAAPDGNGPPSIGHPPFQVRALRTAPSPFLADYLDSGEAAVIALAVEQHVNLVAIDERRGRMVARSCGLRVTGSIGILLRAKRLGHLPEIHPSILRMTAAGVWLSDALVHAALSEAGEQ